MTAYALTGLASSHPFTPDRRALGLPRCRCGLFLGAAVHFRAGVNHR